MRTIQLHPFSLLTGGAVAALAFVTMAQSVPGSIHALPNPQCQEFLVEYGPHPRDYVQLEEAVPHTVPQGKVLVFTALGGSDTSGSTVRLFFDGVQHIETSTAGWNSGGGYGNATSMKHLPPGLSARAGTVITFDSGSSVTGVAWGYLVDA